MSFLLNGQPLVVDTPFTDANGIQYPSNWLRLSSPEEKSAIGITEVPDPVFYDQRFYWGPNLPKDHTDLVTQWIAKTQQTAGSLLTPTDWMIIREFDNGTPVNSSIKTFRNQIRTDCMNKVSEIKKTTTTDELVAYLTGSEYLIWTTETSN